jgi:hypothetical protein
MFNAISFRTFLFYIFLGFFLSARFTSAQEFHSKAMGVGSCSSSNCHGGITPKNTGNILGNEFVTWYKYDRHSKSFQTLLSPESKRIAYLLGVGSPQSDKLCLDCHATNSTHKAEKFRIEDGVGCESCHGAGEQWLSTHTSKDATHAQNIANGLIDLKNLSTRAQVCSSCHYGDEKKEVTHRLYGAGHPRISFELDTYEAVMPRHWKDSSYKAIDGWVIGQIDLAKRNLAHLKRHISSHEIFPEFSQFSCFSCHQSISQKGFMTRPRSERVGLPRINTTHLETISIILAASKNSTLTTWSDYVSKLHESSNQADSLDAIANLEDQLETIQKKSVLVSSNELRIALGEFISKNPGFDLQLAEQLVMAVASLNQENKKIDQKQLKKLYSIVKNAESYNPGNAASELMHALRYK